MKLIMLFFDKKNNNNFKDHDITFFYKRPGVSGKKHNTAIVSIDKSSLFYKLSYP